jgi:hypothetical protein
MHWDLREAWLVLTLTAKFHILCLFLGAVYVSYLLAQTTFDMRGFLTDKAAGRAPGVRSCLFEMDGRIENLRQFNTMLLILFGIFFANETFSTLRAVQLSALSLSAARIDSFEPLTLFAFFVLVILAFLHGFQWIVAARLRSSRASLWLQEQQVSVCNVLISRAFHRLFNSPSKHQKFPLTTARRPPVPLRAEHPAVFWPAIPLNMQGNAKPLQIDRTRCS